MSARLDQLSESIAELKMQNADRYTGTDAARDQAAAYRLIADHEARLRALERAK